MGLSAQDAAKVLDEHETLVVSQEAAGLGADRAYARTTTRLYLKHARERAQQLDFPPMIPQQGPSSLYHFRLGLGLDPRVAARVLRVSLMTLEEYEGRGFNLPEEFRQWAWAEYADWANRRLRRADRLLAAQAVSPSLSVPDSFASAELDRENAETRRLAYLPRVSSAEAEARTLRFLGVADGDGA